MPQTPSFVVLTVRKTTLYEWSGTLADGRNLYARFRDHAWCVRVAPAGEDAVSGEEIASGTYARSFTYRNLKARTKGIILWPNADDVLDMSPETVESVRVGIEDRKAGRVVGPFKDAEELGTHFDL